MTSNEKIFDAMVRQQVQAQRLSVGEAQRMVQFMGEADDELQGLIVSKLKALGPEADFSRVRLKSFLAEIERKRKSLAKIVGGQLKSSMRDVAAVELAASEAIVAGAIPFEVQLASPSLPAIKALVLDSPFGPEDSKQIIDQWIKDIDAGQASGIARAVQTGMAQGETIEQIQARVGHVQGLSRQHVEAVTRTAVNHAANTARNAFFEENAEIIQAMHWVSTLDGRTSPICRANDGKNRPLGTDSFEGVPTPHLDSPTATPPAHMRCRSLLIAILDGETLADLKRPYVNSRQSRAQREKQHRAEAKRKAGDKWKDMSREERYAATKAERDAWNADVANIGQVPADTTYDDWFRMQTPELQQEILGKGRFQAWKDAGEPHMDRFVDNGRKLTIEEFNERSAGMNVDITPPPPEPWRPIPGETVSERHDRLMQEFQSTYDRMTPAERAKFQSDRREMEENYFRDAGTRHPDTLMMSDAEARSHGFDNRHSIKPENIPDPDGILDGVQVQRASVDGEYAWGLTDEQLDFMWGPERRELFRNGASIEQLFDGNGFLKPIDDLVVQFPEHMRRPGMTWSRERQQQLLYDMTIETQQALEDWGSHHRDYVNYQMDPDAADVRLDVVPRNTREIERLLRDADVVQYDGTVYRGVALTDEGLEEVQRTGVFQNRSFASSSINPDVAYYFARAGRGPNVCIFEIVGGHSGVHVIGMTGESIRTEMEVLLDKDIRYDVIGERRLRDGTYVFQLREIR